MTSQSAKKKISPAAKFLIAIAVLVSLFILAAISFGVWSYNNPNKMLQIAFTPTHSFAEDTPDVQRDYTNNTSWAALPSLSTHASARPEGVMDIAVVPEADVFYVHPTTYLSKEHWNAPAVASDADSRVDNRILKIQASAFNTAGRIFAPRYRQATFGAFFDQEGNGVQAIGLAFTDIVAAFDNYIATRNNGRPFILAGHSQGSLHLLYLLQNRISGTPLAERLIAAYIIGWPVSLEADLAALPDIKACERRDETACVVSFQTFALGGDPSGIMSYMNSTTGLSGKPRKGTSMLCTNPLDWLVGSNETRSAHIGAVVPPEDNNAQLGKPVRHFTGTQCGNDSILYITDLPGEDWQQFKMHGENYHVYDYHMFYMNIRENAAERSLAWRKQKMADNN